MQTAHSTAAELRNECRNSVLCLFKVLHLFAHLLKLGFAVDNKRRNCFIVRFSTDGVELAIHFLNYEIQFSADRAVVFKQFACRGNMARKTDKLLIDADFIRE